MSKRFLVATLAMTIAVPALAQRRQAEMVAMANDAIGTLRDSTSLHLAGFYAIGFGTGIKDLTPFQGQHWITFTRFMANQEVDPNRPTFLMYLPIHDSLIPVGVAYVKRIAATAPLPTDLAGEPTEWHSHAFCRGMPGEGAALSDGPDDCAARGGQASPNQIAMVHTWTVPNPDGPYAHDNPALPYIATGLKPPDVAKHDDRLLGLALGETYGAKLPICHRIEFEARMSGRAESLDAPRAKLRELLGQLRDAERAGNGKQIQAARKNMIAAYDDVAKAYKALARTPEIAARLDVEVGQATGALAHHHM